MKTGLVITLKRMAAKIFGLMILMILLQLIQCKPAADVEKTGNKPLPSFNELNSTENEFTIINDWVIYYVTASPCLNVRVEPSISSKIVDKLKFNASVIKIKKKNKTDEINRKKGHWVEIKFKSDKTGWVFDAYLKEKDDTVKLELEKLYSEFKSIEHKKDIEKFMSLHKKVEYFLKNINNYSHAEHGFHYEYEDKRWRELGIVIPKHGSRFSSFNRLLNIIHDINPHSRYREQTLYAELVRSDGYFCALPNIKAGLEYIDEFPGGPHLPEVYLTLARIYTDLYTITRQRDPDIFKYYQGYARYNNGTPMNVQMKKNKKKAYYYLKKYRKLKPDEDTSYFERLYLNENKGEHFFYASM